jgi:FkbM family methyltransferase
MARCHNSVIAATLYSGRVVACSNPFDPMNNLLAQPWMVWARTRFRESPVARGLWARLASTSDYEQRFGGALLGAVDSNSVVWDVGANVGLYTEKFLSKRARVVCFEPAPDAVDALRSKFMADSPTTAAVEVMPMALSDTEGVANMSVEGASPTNRLQTTAPGAGSSIQVAVRRADELIRAGSAPMPTVLKVDVEGYELEVLKGFGEYLESRELRAVFVEVHFRILHERGLDDAPQRITGLLSAAGFAVRWLDLSHVCGMRA